MSNQPNHRRELVNSSGALSLVSLVGRGLATGAAATETAKSVLLIVIAAAMINCGAAELRVGTATISITPDKPVALDGQFNTRISSGVDNLITATAVAIEAREGSRVLSQAILLSADLVVFRPSVPQPLRERLRAKLPEFDPRKLVMTATHTHTPRQLPRKANTRFRRKV